MPWFIDVELVNPKTGDKVKKRLDFMLDATTGTHASVSALAAKSFEATLTGMIKIAAEKSRDE